MVDAQQHQNLYQSLRLLINWHITKEKDPKEYVPFILRKNGEYTVFVISDFRKKSLNLKENKIIKKNAWDIYVHIAQGLVTKEE